MQVCPDMGANYELLQLGFRIADCRPEGEQGFWLCVCVSLPYATFLYGTALCSAEEEGYHAISYELWFVLRFSECRQVLVVGSNRLTFSTAAS